MKHLVWSMVLVAACGGDDGDNPDAPPGDDAPAIDAADDPDAAGDPDASPVSREGVVIVAEQIQGKEIGGTVGVTLSTGALFGGPATTAGDCLFYAAPDESGHSAGVVTIAGLNDDDLTATPDSDTPPVDYELDVGEPPGDIFNDGATLTITAAGAEVPAFTGEVVVPAGLAGVGLPGVISRSAPLEVTWTASDADEMWFWIGGFDGKNIDLIWCRSPDDGSVTVPAATIDLFDETITAAFTIVWRTNQTPVIAGAWGIDLIAAHAVGGNELVEVTD
jgi:hypothetical protein